MLNPTHLATLRIVLRTGSFALGAKTLGYTGSAVSQHISALEAKTGLMLFERTARSVKPTPAAFALAELSEAALSELAALERTARDLARGQRGKLRIGSFPTASARLLPAAVSGFLEATPNAEVLLDEGEPADLIPRLLDGELDVAIVYRYDHVPWQPPASLAVTDLVAEPLLVLRPRDVDSTAAKQRDSQPGQALSLKDVGKLRAQRFIAPLPGSAGALCLERICANAGFTPNIAFRSNDYAVIAGFVGQGLGIAVVPSLAYRPGRQISAHALTPRTTRRHILALHRETSYQPLRRLFLEQLSNAVVQLGTSAACQFENAIEAN